MNIVQIIAKENKNHLHRNAIIDQGKIITYAQLWEAVEKASKELTRLEIRRFNRVALLCQDSADYIVMSLAVLKLYAVIVPVPFGSTDDEINSLLKNIKINFLVFQKNSYSQKNAQAINNELLIIKLATTGRLNNNFYKINPAFIRFSSGTTGTNKGVVLSHKSILERTTAANKGLQIKPGEQIIWVLSMSFHFVVTILLFLRRSSTIIISSRNFPQDLLANLNRYPATFIYASPLHYHLLTSLNIPKKSLACVRLAVSTAIKLPETIAKKFQQKFGFPLTESYGIIEVGLPFVNLSGKLTKCGSVGKILPDYQIKILNADAQGIGEIYIKGKGMFEAYFYPWRARAKVLIKGWFNTGDLGRLDENGYLFILGRHKQIINFNGMKVFPFEIESLLNTHPLIKESLCFGKLHPEYGQIPVAKIVLKNSRCTLNPEILRKFCYQHLAAYKVPKEFQQVSSLAKTVSGKLKIVV